MNPVGLVSFGKKNPIPGSRDWNDTKYHRKDQEYEIQVPLHIEIVDPAQFEIHRKPSDEQTPRGYYA